MTREEFKRKYHGKKFYIQKDPLNKLGENGYPSLAQKLKYTSVKGIISVHFENFWRDGIYLCQNLPGLEGSNVPGVEKFGFEYTYLILLSDFGYLNLRLIDREDKLKRILGLE